MCIISSSFIPNDTTNNLLDAATLNQRLVSIISYRALKETNRTFEAIVQLSWPWHGLGELDFLRFIPILSFAEGTIHQIEEEYEVGIDNPHFVPQHLPALREMLTRLNLYDGALETELQQGLMSYRLERQLCLRASVTEEEIVLADRFKCLSCRFLNRLLFKLTARPYDEAVLDLFALGEQITAIEDDIKQYTQDVEYNTYNTYRMFVRLYGATASQYLLQYLDDLQTEAQKRLTHLAWDKPEMARRMFEFWRTDRRFHQLSEIPEPIVES